MFSNSHEYADVMDNTEMDERVALILELTRRIGLLDELMASARAKRCSRNEDRLRLIVATLA